MKTLLIYLLCILSTSLFAQEWKPYKIDDSVQVSLPPDFKKIDTLGKINITARTTFGDIQISKHPDNPLTTPDIEKLKHLNAYYDDFVKRINTSTKDGKVINEQDTLLGKLHVKDFTLEVDSGSGKHLRNFRILHENSATYVFQYLYKDISEEYATPESDTFFNSIKIPPTIGVASQFTSPENTTGEDPINHTTLYIGIGIVLLLIIAVVFYFKRKRRR